MSKHAIFFLLFISFIQSVSAQDECTERYRSKIFNQVQFTSGIYFGEWTSSNGLTQKLHYDVYEPKGDTASQRPLIIFWHGGAFLDMFKRNTPDIVMMAKDLARMGYVVISPDYRGIKDLTEFQSEKKLVQTVVGAALDGNQLVCHILDEIENGNNPYRIRKDEIFGGGVSGGSFLGLHLLMLQKTEDLPAAFVDWAREVDGGIADEILANKFCGHPNIIKGFINISGALVDTSFIRYTPVKFLHIHGGEDEIVPFDFGIPLAGVTAAPDLYGSYSIDEKSKELGISSDTLFFRKLGHVPFLNLDLERLLTQFHIVDVKVYGECLDKMVDFLFDQITCEKVDATATFIRPTTVQELRLYPNPTNSDIHIEMPESQLWKVSLLDVAGRTLGENQFYGTQFSQSVNHLSKGMYWLKITSPDHTDQIFMSKFIHQ